MEFIQSMPVYLLAMLIFGLRIIDVSIGTVRTLAIVEGRLNLSVALGFCEVLVWILAVSQVISRIHESPFLPVFYAAGFAAGNASGILLEKRLAIGSVVLRIISTHGDQVAEALRQTGQVVTTFPGQGRDGPTTLVYAFCPRKLAPQLITIAQGVDPDLFFVTERSNAWGRGRDLIAHQNAGWRARFVRK